MSAFLSIAVPSGLLAALFRHVPFFAGAILGVGITVAGALVTFWVVQATGTAPTMAGEAAEQWTAQELRALRRDGWRLVNHLHRSRGAGDIDHVMVGPGGLVVVETKWTADAWTGLSDHRIVAAAEQVRRGSRSLALHVTLRKNGINKAVNAVALWGAGSSRPTASLRGDVDGVTILPGRQLQDWVRELPVQLSGTQVDEAFRFLVMQTQAWDSADPEDLLPSVSSLVAKLLFSVGAGMMGCLASTLALRLPGGPPAWLGATASIGALTWLARRQSRGLRTVVSGLLTGEVAGVVLISLAYLLA